MNSNSNHSERSGSQKRNNPKTDDNLTVYLKGWGNGSFGDRDKAISIIYQELHYTAALILNRHKNSYLEIQPTALIHEAFIKLNGKKFSVEDRSRFLALAATVMRRYLVDYVREHMAQKRHSNQPMMTISKIDSADSNNEYTNLLELNDLLDALEKINQRQSRLCELFYFGGLSLSEIAEIEKISKSTVNNELRFARAWLKKASKPFSYMGRQHID